MKALAVLLICGLMNVEAGAQVIYERTYPNPFPSLKEAIQLSDYSTVSFSNNSPCYFAGWRHISSEGDIIAHGGLAGESTHSLRTRQIARDSVLVSFREGPLDFDGTNFFKVLLWTPSGLTTLVEDTIPLFYWDDYEGSNNPIQYDACLLTESHLVYRRGDTLYAKNLLSGNIEFKEVFLYINNVVPAKNGLMVFSAGLPPTYFDAQLIEVKTWINLSSHPIALDLVALDSFVIGINLDVPTAIHAVNVFTEHSIDIDLSAYFMHIDSLVTRGDVLIVTGQKGSAKNALHLNQQFEIIHETPYALPDSLYTWALSFYPDRVYAWRTDGLAGYKANYRVAYPYLNPKPITYVDLEFADIKVDSMYFWSTSEGSPLILILSARIVNKSPDTLHSLTIHHQLEPFQMCDPGVYPRHAAGLLTPPGDTASVKFSVGLWEDLLDEPFLQTYYVHHGNHHLDSNLLDNTFEFVFLFSSTEELTTSLVCAYPNPFYDFIAINPLAEPMKLFLYDQAGKLVATGQNQLDNLGSLTPGMYVLHVIQGQSRGITKVVKME